jgi:non-ribosomal peptide synthase protein (TIGR01720 family)
VKIRGQRVELGEIEYNLQRALMDEARAENVQIIAEVIKPEGSDIPTLVSFLFMTVSSGMSSDNARLVLDRAVVGMEDRLLDLVPPYMIPSAFIPVATVPMTPTGKVDRRSLREQGSAMYWQQLKSQAASEQSEPESELETKIHQIWSDVLNLSYNQIVPDSAFTRLGGDSITAMQVVSRCRAQNISVKVADILRHQTIRKIAQCSKPVEQKLNLHSTGDREGEAWPLAPIQQIFFDNNPQGINHYTLSYILKLARRTTQQELLAALLAVTSRHDMLRARFRKRADQSAWEQYIAPTGPESFLLKQHDFKDGLTMQHVVDERQAGMDLVNGPVFAIDVFNSPNEEQTLLMSAHHVMMDLVSWRVVWHELTQYLSGVTRLAPLELSFQAWSRLQREEAEELNPAAVLPFEITPANFAYWDVSPGELIFKDSVLNLSFVDAEATALLLGASNDCLRTEVLDILVGTLVFCFAQVFPDRNPPAVFLEGHGREPVAGMEDLDMSEIVGWFTSIHPVQVGGESSTSLFDMIKFAKDIRRRVPGKGRPYFASRFFSTEGKKAFESHKYAELIFNYRGSVQQLEDAKSVFKLENRESRNLLIPGDGPEYQRPSLVDMNLVVQEGKLQLWTRSHKHMRNHEAVTRWVKLYAETLSSVAHELTKVRPCYTLADFPVLDISYTGLEELITKQLANQGVVEADIHDIYPCTPMQEGILISTNAGAASYQSVCIWEAVLANSKVSVPRLAAAWRKISRMHPVFATIFSTHPDTGRFVQVVLSNPNDVSLCQATGSMTASEHLRQMQGPTAPNSKPECYFTICTGSSGEVACRLDMTHALMDALSLPVIVRDLEKAYAGEALTLRKPFRDYVEHIQRTPASQRLTYWENYLTGVQSCALPGDKAATRPENQRNSSYGWLIVPSASTAQIAEVCRKNGMTRSTFLHLAWSLVLAHFTGQRQVCFGYLSSGRDTQMDGIENIVGPLINMLIARVDLEQPLSNVMQAINKYNIEHLECQHVSLAEVQHKINVKQLFNTNITVRDAGGESKQTASGVQLVKVLEEDPHEVSLMSVAYMLLHWF